MSVCVHMCACVCTYVWWVNGVAGVSWTPAILFPTAWLVWGFAHYTQSSKITGYLRLHFCSIPKGRGNSHVNRDAFDWFGSENGQWVFSVITESSPYLSTTSQLAGGDSPSLRTLLVPTSTKSLPWARGPMDSFQKPLRLQDWCSVFAYVLRSDPHLGCPARTVD